MTIEAGGDINAGDGGYNLSTQERYEEFKRSRMMNEPVTKEREQLAAVKLALEVLEIAQNNLAPSRGSAHAYGDGELWDKYNEAITALQSIIEQQPAVQEPCCYGGIAHDCHAGPSCRIAKRLSTTPPETQQCKWPTCQREDYQQALAEQIKRELVGEQPAPVQEPCGRLESDPYEGHIFVPRIKGDWSMLGKDLYTTPPIVATPLAAQQKPWVGLTEEELDTEATNHEQAHGFIQGAQWAEVKLKEKNNA
jgi:hypothetical protein